MKRTRSSSLVVFFLLVSGIARAQGHPEARSLAEMKFETIPGIPTCARAAVMSGDPGKGASILVSRLSAGCVIPWHWHTPDEHLMIVSGTATVQPKDAAPLTLRSGSYAMMPGRHVHQFRCRIACTFYVSAGATFDIHYVDREGKEISPDDALKPVNERPAKPPQ
jgi:quercetin dioxygenase-like cupin family protein